MDAASVAISVADIAIRTANQVSRFVQGVRNADGSSVDFLLKVDAFGDTIDAVRGVLKAHKEKIGSRSVDSEQLRLLKAAMNTLQFCRHSLEKLEEKF